MNFYIDFEATQFSNRIISIGCSCENNSKFYTLVKPADGSKVNKFITELTGITNEMLVEAPTADEAFLKFKAWVIENSNNTIPYFYCYGNCDEKFIEGTVKYMKNFDAALFALAVKGAMSDYSIKVAKCLNLQQVALFRVYSILHNTNEAQDHDALKDAEMLQYVIEHINLLIPADADRLPPPAKKPYAKLKGPKKPNTTGNFIVDGQVIGNIDATVEYCWTNFQNCAKKKYKKACEDLLTGANNTGKKKIGKYILELEMKGE